MKLFIFFILIAVFSVPVLCELDKSEIIKYVKECHDKHHISQKEFEDFISRKSEPSENMKCSIHCTMVKEGTMDEAGTFKPDVAKTNHSNDDKFAAAVDACKNTSGSSPCDTAFKIHQCLSSQKEKDNQ